MIGAMVTAAARASETDRASLRRAGLDGYRFIESVAALPFVEAIWLYGSRARGQHRERSDIDLAISAPGASESEWQQVLNLIEDADTLLHIDCVRLDALPDADPLRASILADHQVLWGKSQS